MKWFKIVILFCLSLNIILQQHKNRVNRFPAVSRPSLESCFELFSRITRLYQVEEINSEFSFGQALSYVPTYHQMRNLEDIETLKISSYNLNRLNLVPSDTGVGVNFQYEIKVNAQARILQELDSDIIVLNEVGGLDPLFRFNEKKLDKKYVPLVLPGNDEHSSIAFLIKRNLPIKVKLHSFSDYSSSDFRMNTPIFTRDFPVLELRTVVASDNSPPLLLIGGTHLRSLINGNSERSRLQRAQANSMIEIRGLFRQRYGRDIPFVIAGDFNNSIQTGQVARELQALPSAGFRDALDRIENPELGSCNCRTTFTHHPAGTNATEYVQLDSIQVTNGVSVQGAGIFRYRNRNQELPLPSALSERNRNPSDHFPVWAEFNLQTLIP